MSTLEDQGAQEWSSFVRLLGQLSRAPADSVTPDARLVRDLGFDSLALAELALSLREKYETADHQLEFDGLRWNTTTAGQLFENCTAGAKRPPV